MSEIERHPLVENVAKALADAAKEEGYSWYFDEMDGERFLGWDDLPDEDLDVGGEHWVKGRNYYREMARVSLATLHLDEGRMTEERAPRPLWPEWVDYVEMRKMMRSNQWQVRAIGDLAVEPWEKMIGSTRRVAVEHTSEDYDEAVAETSKRAWWKQEEADA